MILADSEDDEIELIIKFIKSKKVTFNEKRNQTFLISDEDYLIKQPGFTQKLKKLFEQKP